MGIYEMRGAFFFMAAANCWWNSCALVASSSLCDCCQRIENYFRLVNQGGSLNIVEQQ